MFDLDPKQMQEALEQLRRLNDNLEGVRRLTPDALRVLGKLADGSLKLKGEMALMNRILFGIVKKSGAGGLGSALMELAKTYVKESARRPRR